MIGDRLASARRSKGLSQVELAVALGDRYNQQMISHVERGRSSLLVDGLKNAALELGVSTDYLLGLADDPAPASLCAPADSVSIPSLPGISATDLGSVAQPELESFPVPQTFLMEHQIDPRRARVIKIRGQAMYPALPRGALALVDFARKWLTHNLIYLIIINAGTQRESYEVRRLREDDTLAFHWHTDFHMDLEDGGNSWFAGSWRRDLWKEEIQGNILLSRNLSEFAPIPHDEGVRVLGQVRGVLHIFDDEGW